MKQHRKKLDELLTRRKLVAEQLEKEKADLALTEDDISATVEAQGIVQHVAQEVQQQANQRIASVVTRCLESVFEEEAYEFRIDFERKRSKTEARISFVRDSLEVDPLTASGGGVVDVASFALRLACLLLSKPPLRRLIVLDEPFKHLSVEYRPRIRTLLKVLSEDFDVQFVLVTHLRDLETGAVVHLD